MRRANALQAVGVVAVVVGTLLLVPPARQHPHLPSTPSPPPPRPAPTPTSTSRSKSAIQPSSRNIDPCDCNDAKNVTVHLPAGLIGNPHATPQCTIAQFASDQCPVDSQVGVAEVKFASR